ncbi:MAG: hypothetical protein M3441_13820 [Chloroflexota bacterium]|nr:hypothetical protein [Chloroflexota bacterium]
MLPLNSSNGHQCVMPDGAVTQVAVGEAVAVRVEVRVGVLVAVPVGVPVGVKLGWGVAVPVDVLVAVEVLMTLVVAVPVGVELGLGVAVSVGFGVALAVAQWPWPVGSSHVGVAVAQGMPASQVGVAVASGAFVLVAVTQGMLEHTVAVEVEVSLSQSAVSQVDVASGVLVLVAHGIPASHVGVGEAHWPLVPTHTVAVGVSVKQCPGSHVAVAVGQMAPGAQVAVGEGQRPCPLVSTHTVAVAEGQPTAGFGHTVAVAVGPLGSQGTTGHRVSVGVAVCWPFGGRMPFAGSAPTRFVWVVIPAATATLLSKAISITTVSIRNWKYRLLLS